MKTDSQMAEAAAKFAARWEGRGYERGESQPFWIDLLSHVFGVETPTDGFIRFEEHHKVDESNFVDGRIPSTRVLIEQKSLGKDLRAPIRQSDGALLNPFQQARRYVVGLPVSEHPRWIVTCNFSEFLVYDMEQPNGEPEQIMLKDLGREYYRLKFLVDAKNEHISKEMQVSMQAGEIVGKIYDALLKQYDDNSPEALRWLNILCVRIVFCLYAEDAEIFTHDQFHDFLTTYEAKDMRRALRDLFEVLNTPQEKRSKYLQDDLKAFPYTNGGLFAEEIEIPQFTEALKQTLLQNASLDFDWSEISPTIFGAVFESTLNPETRRSGGMHYTSIENIHKVIDPLFLNDLRRELDEILEEKVERQRQRKLGEYQSKLSSLTFLDPACGSGNFLTETYLSLRRLENEAIREMYHGQMMLGAFVNPVKVSIQQFYGIEINDFAVTVATTALWISEAQMLRETEKIVHQEIDFLPLKSYTNIREGNALRMDWLGGDVSHVATEDASSHVASGQAADCDVRHVASLQFMERHKYIRITGNKLPHWHQNSKVQFVTFRLADSLPQARLAELSEFKNQWLSAHPEPWTKQTEEEYNHIIRNKIDKWLDNNYGNCLLQNEAVRQIVIDSLLFNNGKSYWLHSFVIMPNHVHLLISPIGDITINESVGNVKKFTAHSINRLLGRQGEVWQREIFDRMVRDQQNYEAYERYIYDNPSHLPIGTYSIGGDVSHVATEDVASHVASGNADGCDVRHVASYNAGDCDVRHVASYDYIIGNPPFIGARQMDSEQKQDVLSIFGEKWKNVGNLDYVCCWYKKAFDAMKIGNPKVAFVSTNSICQGEQVANLWQPLMERGLHIDFAHRTFRWDSESSTKAQVHCVIVGFSKQDRQLRRETRRLLNGKDEECLLFDNDKVIKVNHINAYLTAAPDIFIWSRPKPICDVPLISMGNQPIDGGNYLFDKDEMEDFVKEEPLSAAYFHPYYGALEFINRKPRYCLWLGNCTPAELRNMPHCMKRIEAVREVRLSSKRPSTLKLADRPTRFQTENFPTEDYIVIPEVSSEKRRYIPMGIMTPNDICSNKLRIMPNVSRYHFGILQSNVHMAWMRAVAGRLEMRYDYSINIVYNNFPWPTPTDEQRAKIEQTAQAILDARALYPDSSLADLYDELTMPPELRKAHQENDRAVMQAYGFPVKSTFTESHCVAELFRLYNEITK
ncbi:MAG: transposase [Prevotella sp.]|nr:transposase [Prevotella sp.]